MKALTLRKKTLLVAASGVETAGCPLLSATTNRWAKKATIEGSKHVANTESCRVGDKGLNLVFAAFFLRKINTMISILDLESEVSKSAALIELLSDRLCREIEERGGSHAETTAAGLVAMAIDQSGNLIRTFYAVCDEERGQRSVRN